MKKADLDLLQSHPLHRTITKTFIAQPNQASSASCTHTKIKPVHTLSPTPLPCLWVIIPSSDSKAPIHSPPPFPHTTSFEKTISGKYLGELVRLALQKLVRCGQLFGGKSSTKFDQFEAFKTEYVSIIEGRFVTMLTCELILCVFTV